jgi:hypothetical protein
MFEPSANYYLPSWGPDDEECPEHEGYRAGDCYEPHCYNCAGVEGLMDCPKCGAGQCAKCWRQVGQCIDCGHSPIVSIAEAMHAYRAAALEFLNGGK